MEVAAAKFYNLSQDKAATRQQNQSKDDIYTSMLPRIPHSPES